MCYLDHWTECINSAFSMSVSLDKRWVSDGRWIDKRKTPMPAMIDFAVNHGVPRRTALALYRDVFKFYHDLGTETYLSKDYVKRFEEKQMATVCHVIDTHNDNKVVYSFRHRLDGTICKQFLNDCYNIYPEEPLPNFTS